MTTPPPKSSADIAQHWENVHQTREPDRVGWYQEVPARCLTLIERFAPDRSTRIIDVGCGASRLVDQLLERGYERITAIDLASSAVSRLRDRLTQHPQLDLRVGNVLSADFERGYGLWHDRAFFHFLTASRDRGAYVYQLLRALSPGGHAVLATFALDGPEACSNLPVVRYDAQALQRELGPSRFELVHELLDAHQTPGGVTQSYQYAVFKRL